jgi:NADH-quinone oxidoreductase subunit N
MTPFDFMTLLPIFSELFIVLSALVLLMVGAFNGNKSTATINVLAVMVLVGSSVLMLNNVPENESLLGNMLIKTPFTQFVKQLILISGVLTLILTQEWLKEQENQRFEYPVLVLLAVAGMMFLVSANNLISVYVAVELMSLALYVLASFQRDNLRSTEAGLKYFVLGSLASGIMLFGMSLVYGFSGTTEFSSLNALFTDGLDVAKNLNLIAGGLLVGIILMLVGFAFKVSAAPFHMWTPDVYEGAPTPVTLFFATAPKVAGIAIFVRVLLEPFGKAIFVWQDIIVFISIASMLVGAFGALTQTNIKRLLAYSSIGHVGYVLVGLATGTIAGVQGILIYLNLYIIMSAGAFGCILLMKQHGKWVEDISDLAGLSQTHSRMAFALAIFLFSMAGIPPLAGFFGKFYIFIAAVQNGMYLLAVIGVLSSVVSCFYYLKIVKTMYFDAPKERFDSGVSLPMQFVIACCTLFTLCFFALPSWLIESAKAAASSIFM